MAIEGEFWVTRWVRKLDIGEVRVVVDGVGCTFRVNGGYRIERRTVRPRDRDTSVIHQQISEEIIWHRDALTMAHNAHNV